MNDTYIQYNAETNKIEIYVDGTLVESLDSGDIS